MAASEPLEANVKSAEVALKKEKQDVESEKLRARERTMDDQQQLEKARAERAEVVAQIQPAFTHDTSESGEVERARGGRGAGGALRACYITLRPQFVQDLRRGDQTLTCESCGRILFYNPPVDVEPRWRADRRVSPAARDHRRGTRGPSS